MGGWLAILKIRLHDKRPGVFSGCAENIFLRRRSGQAGMGSRKVISRERRRILRLPGHLLCAQQSSDFEFHIFLRLFTVKKLRDAYRSETTSLGAKKR